jgi:hypothetical protein
MASGSGNSGQSSAYFGSFDDVGRLPVEGGVGFDFGADFPFGASLRVASSSLPTASTLALTTYGGSYGPVPGADDSRHCQRCQEELAELSRFAIGPLEQRIHAQIYGL